MSAEHTPSDDVKASNDSLADMAAAELLDAMQKPINGIPSVRMIHYKNARRFAKAALLAVFESSNASQEPKAINADLLAACKTVREVLEKGYGFGGIIKMLEEAIAKAEGAT